MLTKGVPFINLCQIDSIMIVCFKSVTDLKKIHVSTLASFPVLPTPAFVSQPCRKSEGTGNEAISTWGGGVGSRVKLGAFG